MSVSGLQRGLVGTEGREQTALKRPDRRVRREKLRKNFALGSLFRFPAFFALWIFQGLCR
jgi:hypothetical protein